ncbi:MAG: helix-turn-helix domain-containing protein [Clostridia bacterium]|nr:helix-turn-helix domain-containing protein [Clostridia bacterium]
MDQVKIGDFIATERKRLGLTQNELAEKLSISNKTVSKWETGRGLPEVSLMLPLCEILGVTVNELLAGERITENAEKKAEENLMLLLESNEKTDRGKRIFLSASVAVPLSAAAWLLCFADSNIWQIGDIPTPLTAVYLLTGFALIFGTAFFGLLGLFLRKPLITLTAVRLALLTLVILGIAYSETMFFLISAAGIALTLAISIMVAIRRKRR